MKASAGQKKEHKKKKPYVKPEVKQVPLRPEEAVLAACKVLQTAGPLVNCVGQGGCQGNGS